MTTYLPCVEINPATPATASVIWLHGLGADGHDFEPIVPQLQVDTPVRYIFPHAPQRAVTVNGGYLMRAWYDILSFERPRAEDEAGIRASEQQLRALIEREQQRGIAVGRIVLAGFSQGGAIALHAGLRYPRALAGIMALSTYLPLAEHIAAESADANHGTPIFMAHGDQDPVIALPHAQSSKRALEALGYPVEWRVYPMAHGVSGAEIEDIRAFLGRVLPEVAN
ncbi:MAG: dienelactone hydrolase family protein [Pseudomonadota bacterium]